MAISAFITVLLFILPPAYADGSGPLVGGFPRRHLDEAGIQLIQDNFRMFTDYISDKVGRKIILEPVSDINELRTKLQKRELDFAWAWTAAESMKIWEEYPLTPFVSINPISGENSRNGFRFLLITRSDNNCKKLAELKGKTLFYLNSEDERYKHLSLLSVEILLKKHGKDINKFFQLSPYGSGGRAERSSAVLEYGRSKDLILRVISDPDVAASVGEEAYLLMVRRNPKVAEMITVIATTEPLITTPYFVWKDADPELIKKIKDVLLNMHRDPQGEEILRSVRIGAWVDVGENSYETLKRLFAEAEKLGIKQEL